MNDWPRTDIEKAAATHQRLADLLLAVGEEFYTRAGDFKAGLSGSGPDAPSRPSCNCDPEDPVQMAGCTHGSSVERRAFRSDQLERDCTNPKEAMDEAAAHAAAMIHRILRVLQSTAGGLRCSECGNPIDPKSEKVKWWRGRRPCHPSPCYTRLQRAEKRKAS